MGQQERRERLAETARAEVAEHIRNNPGKWVVEIVEYVMSTKEYDVFVADCLFDYANRSNDSGPGVISEAIDRFAEQAGQSAYDCIISHPGAGL